LYEQLVAERKEVLRKAQEEEEKRRIADEQRWRALAFRPRREAERRMPAAVQPIPGQSYHPQPTHARIARRGDDAAARAVLERYCRAGMERTAHMGGAQKRKSSDLEEEEWRSRGDYPETHESERAAKRRRKSSASAWWTAGAWVAGALAVGRLFGVF
jgi:hypothetical protein